MNAKQIIFHGEVQGEGFRYAVAHEAMNYDIKGEVENRADGTVEAKVIGDDDEIQDFLNAIIEGRWSEELEEIEIREIDVDARHYTAGFRFH